MAQRKFTIFDGSTTGIADGVGTWLRVREVINLHQDGVGEDVTDETIHIVLTGSPNGTTIKLITANDLTSPMIYATGKNLQDAGTMADIAITETGSFNVVLPKGVYFTLIISGTGSPLPAWVASARGEIISA